MLDEKGLMYAALSWAGFVTWGGIRSLTNQAKLKTIDDRTKAIEEKIDKIVDKMLNGVMHKRGDDE